MAEIAAYTRAIGALRRALQFTRPDLQLSPNGAVAQWQLNLIPGIEAKWFEADLRAGEGRELDGKFRAAHSSSALVVNTFSRFKPKPSTALLQIAGWSGFYQIQFEAKCPAGVHSSRPPHRESPPNLDLLLISESNVLGVESKCTEHLRSDHVAKFSPAYDKEVTDWRRETAWFRLMQTLIKEPRRYRFLDTAQLVKHAFGLGRCFEGQATTLLYIYWEPRNAAGLLELRQHREEVARFSDEVAGTTPSFKALSYRDLWREWEALSSPSWLPEQLSALQTRYDVEI